jgi:hypothetical protein
MPNGSTTTNDKAIRMTDRDSSDAEIRRVCAILESISNAYPADSDETNAIKDAPLAYIVVHQHDSLKKRYQDFRLAVSGDLTDEMKADLRRHGIEPDDLEDDLPLDGTA